MQTTKDQLDDNEINQIVLFINNFRREFEVPELIYNDIISKECKDISINYLRAQMLNKEVKMNTEQINISYQKHVRNQKMLNIKNIITKWYNEKKNYNFEDDSKTKYKSCQNFINLMYESNKEFGFWYSYINGKCVLCMKFSETEL